MKPTDEVTLSTEARSLIDGARDADDPSDADRARVKRALMATIAGGAGLVASTAASSAAASAAGTAGLSVAAKVAAVVLVFGAIGGTVALTANPPAPEHETHAAEARPARRSAPEARGHAMPAPMHVEPAHDPELALEPEPAIEGALEVPSGMDEHPQAETADAPASAQRVDAPRAATTVAPASRARRPAVEPPAAAPSTLAEEVGLLRRAQGAIRAGDPDAALASLAEHARRFPTGAMAEEREAARVVALCRAGRRDEARAAATRFLATRADSPLATRVRTACE